MKAADTFTVNGQLLCEPCADKKVGEIQSAKGKLEVLRSTDPTICFKCSGDFGSVELPLVGGLHACESCRLTLLNFQYPLWLKASFVALLVLLAVSLVHGRSYFVTGYAYYQGKKLLESGHPSESVPHFQKALASGTNSGVVIQTAALAYLKAGYPEDAAKAVEGREFAQDDLFRSLDSEFKRWDKAATTADDAVKLYGEKKYKDAAKRMHEAVAKYPAITPWVDLATRFDYAAFFYEQDYDGLVGLAEKTWAKHHDYDTAAALAGAYGCRYAVSGDEAEKEKATKMMEQARILAKSKEELEDFREWQPRFDHRISTRRILDSEQYRALFEPAPVTTAQTTEGTIPAKPAKEEGN